MACREQQLGLPNVERVADIGFRDEQAVTRSAREGIEDCEAVFGLEDLVARYIAIDDLAEKISLVVWASQQAGGGSATATAERCKKRENGQRSERQRPGKGKGDEYQVEGMLRGDSSWLT